MPFRARPRRFLCCKSSESERRAETQKLTKNRPSIRQSPKKGHPFVIVYFGRTSLCKTDGWVGFRGARFVCVSAVFAVSLQSFSYQVSRLSYSFARQLLHVSTLLNS